MPKPRKNELPPLEIPLDAVADRIVKYRKLRGLTQKELAERIGITRDILASYESGRAHLNDEIIVRFSLALRISTDDLLGLSKNDHILEAPPNVRLIKRMKQIEKLSPVDQKAILRTIDSFIKGVDL